MISTLRICDAADLDRGAIVDVAAGRRLELSSALLEALAAQRMSMLAAVASGRSVYGVNTGLGAQSGIRLTVGEQTGHQNNMLLARAAGGPPWLPRPAVRAVLAVRLGNFLLGDAGVSVDLVNQLVRFLNSDLLPAIPAAGYGSAGEIVSLAHAFGPLIGVGSVLGPLPDSLIVDAAQVLRANDVAPIMLGVKEGVALIQGVPGTTALAVLAAEHLRRLIDQMITVAAMSIAAAAAPQSGYLPELARGDPDLAAVTTALRARLAGTDRGARSLQAPVSFRVAGVVLAHLTRSVTGLHAAIDRALAGVTDSPAFVEGEFVGTAGFYGLDLAAGLDAVAVALGHAAEVSAARLHRLLDSRFTGLNAQLAADPGPDTGLISVHKRAAGTVHQLRRTSASSVIGAIETSFGQEDVQTFSWEAAGNLGVAIEGATDVLACELFTACRALTISGCAIGPGLESAMLTVQAMVEPIEGDREFGRDIETLHQLLLDDALPGS